jgi:hypothetical protein
MTPGVGKSHLGAISIQPICFPLISPHRGGLCSASGFSPASFCLPPRRNALVLFRRGTACCARHMCLATCPPSASIGGRRS